MDITGKITQTIEPSLEALGYAVVLVKLADSARRKTLMVMAERKDETPMSFDDCTEISRTVSALLDVEDPIQAAYDLEVCSPGMDRPLTKEADFVRFVGCEAKCETMLPIDGRKRFRGVLTGMKDGMIAMDMHEGTAQIPFANLRGAKLVPVFETETVHKPGGKKNKK